MAELALAIPGVLHLTLRLYKTISEVTSSSSSPSSTALRLRTTLNGVTHVLQKLDENHKTDSAVLDRLRPLITDLEVALRWLEGKVQEVESVEAGGAGGGGRKKAMKEKVKKAKVLWKWVNGEKVEVMEFVGLIDKRLAVLAYATQFEMDRERRDVTVEIRGTMQRIEAAQLMMLGGSVGGGVPAAAAAWDPAIAQRLLEHEMKIVVRRAAGTALPFATVFFFL